MLMGTPWDDTMYLKQNTWGAYDEKACMLAKFNLSDIFIHLHSFSQ